MEAEKAIYSYLRSRGFKLAETALRSEIQHRYNKEITGEVPQCEYVIRELLSDHFLTYNTSTYINIFKHLSEWISSSIPHYKTELSKILGPLLIYLHIDLLKNGHQSAPFYEEFSAAYMDYSEVKVLGSIQDQQSLGCSFVSSLLDNYYRVPMSKHALSSLIHFIVANQYSLLLRIINQHFKIDTAPDPSFLHPILMFDDAAFIYDKIPLILNVPFRDGVHEDNRKKERIPLPVPHPELELYRKQDQKERTDLNKRLPDIVQHTIQGQVLCIDISEDSTVVACGLENSVVKVWDFLEGSAKELVGHSGSVYCVSIELDKKLVVSGSEDCSLRLWSISTGTCLTIYRFHYSTVWAVSFCILGYYFVSGSLDGTACIWTTDNPNPIRVLVGHMSEVNIVKFHPSINYVGTASPDRTVRVWDLYTGNCVRIFVGHVQEVTAFTFSINGKLLFTADCVGNLKCWQMDQQLLIWQFSGTQCIEAIAPSQATEIVAVGCQDGTLLILSGSNGQVVKTLKTKDSSILFLNFNWRNLLSVGAFNDS